MTPSARPAVALTRAALGTTLVLALAACGGPAAAAQARACGVARAAQKGLMAAPMSGPAMTGYATALSDARATGALAGPVGQAITDAGDAAADARHGDPAQYRADTELFVSDLAAIESTCQRAAS